MSDQASCWTCCNLPGCTLVRTGKGEFDRSKIIDEENPKDCDQWGPIEGREAETRAALHDMVGASTLRALNILDRAPLEDLEEEDDMGYVPDFVGMIREGMSPEERIDQFLFETDDDGEILEENGNKVPRGQLALRKYAGSKEGPIEQVFPAERETIAFCDFNKVLEKVIRAEKKLGWIAKSTKTKKKKKETKMAIKIRRNSKKPAPAATSEDKTPSKVKSKAEKVEKPATPKTKRTVRKPAASKVENDGGHAAAASVDTEALKDMVNKAVGEALKEPLERLESALENIQSTLGTGHKGRSITDLIIDTGVISHDVFLTKMNMIMLMLQVGEDGEIPEDGVIPDPVEAAEQDNLLTQDEPVSIIEHYLDGGEGEGDED